MWFYCFDELGNLYRGGRDIIFFQSCKDVWISACNSIEYMPKYYNDTMYVYFSNGGHQQVSDIEGKVRYRKFWLYSRDDKKAAEIAQDWVNRKIAPSPNGNGTGL